MPVMFISGENLVLACAFSYVTLISLFSFITEEGQLQFC